MTRTIRAAVLGLPLTMRVGLGVAFLGGAIDVGYHLFADSPGMGHGPIAFAGHVVTLTGMVITMVGLLRVAFASRPSESSFTTQGEIR